MKASSFIMNHVPYGWLFRLMHVVGSNLMVAVVLLHMGSVFFLGSYKKPRELTWVVGASAVADDSGLLPQRLSPALEPAEFLGHHGGDQHTYGLSGLLESLFVKFFRGSENVSGATLNRFFRPACGLSPGNTYRAFRSCMSLW